MVERIPAGVIGDEDEIIGFHLEQASLRLAELGSSSARAAALADRASDLFAAAAQRATGRGDYRAAANLLGRARALLTPVDERLQALGVTLAEALYATGELKHAEALLRETRQLAAARGDTRTEWLATILHVRLKDHLEPERWDADEVRRTAQQALTALEPLEADRSLAQAWLLLGYVDWSYCRHDAATKAYERGLACVRHLEDEHTERLVVQNLIATLYHGPMPASEAIARIEELTAQTGSRTLEPFALVRLAGLHTMQGRFDEGRALYERSKAMFQELGLTLSIATGTMNAREIHLLAGEAEEAERELRWGYETLEQMGEKGRRSTLAASLAEALYDQRRYEEAERFARESLEDASPEDVASQVMGRMVTAKLLAVKGTGDQAEQAAREAAALAEQSDDLFMLGGANLALAEVLLLAGKRDEAIRALEAAADASDRKGNIVSTDGARVLLAELER